MLRAKSISPKYVYAIRITAYRLPIRRLLDSKLEFWATFILLGDREIGLTPHPQSTLLAMTRLLAPCKLASVSQQACNGCGYA